MAKETLNLEVKSNIKSVTKDTDELGESLKKTTTETKDLDKGLEDAGKSGKKGFKAIGTGVKAFGMALKAAGIGLIIALFASLTEALSRNQKVMNTVNTVMTTISTTFNQVVDVLVDVFSWVTASQDRFDGLTKVIKSLMTLALTPLKTSFYAIKLAVQAAMLAWEDSFLGGGDEGKMAELRVGINETKQSLIDIKDAAIKAGKDIVENVGDAIGEIGAIGEMVIDQVSKISIKANFETAKATTAAGNASKLAEVQIQGLIEKYDRQAEIQRQIRDDERKTFAERKKANDEIAIILKKQEKEMLALADTRVASALLERNANKDNVDLEIAYQATLNDRKGVLAQITGFASEQKTNEAALDKELLETKNQIAAELLEGQDRELLELKQAYELKLDMARKAGVDNLEITEQYEKEEQAIKDSYADAALAKAEAIAKKQEDIDKAVLSAKVNLTKQAFGVLGVLAGENVAAGKAIAVAETIFNTQQGIMAAMGATSVADKLLPFPLRLANAIGVGIMGASAVKTILSTNPGSGGGASVPSAGGATPAPQMMSGAFELGGGQEIEPVQAYVVSDDITDSQNSLEIIRRRATI